METTKISPRNLPDPIGQPGTNENRVFRKVAQMMYLHTGILNMGPKTLKIVSVNQKPINLKFRQQWFLKYELCHRSDAELIQLILSDLSHFLICDRANNFMHLG